MKNFLLCAITLGLTTAAHAATLAASWTDFNETDSNGYTFSYSSGYAQITEEGWLAIDSNSDARQKARVESVVTYAGNPNYPAGAVTMTIEYIAPTDSVAPLIATKFGGVYIGVGLNSNNQLVGLWQEAPWTTLTSDPIDISQPFTLTMAFSQAEGVKLYIDGILFAENAGLKGYGAGGDILYYIGGVGADTPNAGLAPSDFSISDLYIHTGAITGTEVLDFYTSIVAIPEPSTYAFAGLASALAVAVAVRRRKKRSAK